MTVGDRIRRKRLELGLSQEELAFKLGYKSRSSVNKIECARNLPLSKVEKMATVLGCTPSFLMGWEDEEGVPMSDDLQKQIFSRNLLGYLSLSGKSQKEVAESINVSPQTFNTWCQGIALPRMGKVQLLADYFGISKLDLFDEHKHSNEESNYINDDAREMAWFLLENPEHKALFDALRKLNVEDVAIVKAIVDRFGSNS